MTFGRNDVATDVVNYQEFGWGQANCVVPLGARIELKCFIELGQDRAV